MIYPYKTKFSYQPSQPTAPTPLEQNAARNIACALCALPLAAAFLYLHYVLKESMPMPHITAVHVVVVLVTLCLIGAAYAYAALTAKPDPESQKAIFERTYRGGFDL